LRVIFAISCEIKGVLAGNVRFHQDFCQFRVITSVVMRVSVRRRSCTFGVVSTVPVFQRAKRQGSGKGPKLAEMRRVLRNRARRA